MTTPSEADVLSAMRADPDRGLSLLMARYQEPVYWHIRRIVERHDEAADAAQEAFVRIYRTFASFRSECSLSAWVYRIATREALRALSRLRGRPLPLDDEAGEALQIAAETEVDYSDLEAVRLQRALRSLPTKQRLAFTLRYYDDLSYDDIAAAIGGSAASAKTNYHLAKQRIIDYFSRHDS